MLTTADGGVNVRRVSTRDNTSVADWSEVSVSNVLNISGHNCLECYYVLDTHKQEFSAAARLDNLITETPD